MSALLTWARRLVIILLPTLFALPVVAADDGKDFCWKDSYTRGVGTIPESCEAGRDRIGLLCYSKCPANAKRFGFDCHSVCPSGMRDDGLFCRAAEYGRGGGYPWKFGDALNDNGMIARCEAANGRGNCEKNGLIFYPKCKPGYSAFGCCICRPNTPNCSALGLNAGIDLSCAKKVTIGNPVTGVCPGGQKDAGLCYTNCKSGFDGVGPVCWGQPPKGWVQCGMGAAKDSTTCASIVWGQVSSVGQLALSIASLGSSTSLNAGMSAPADASRLAKLKAEASRLKVAYDNLKKTNEKVRQAEAAFDAANKGKAGYEAMSAASEAVTEEDMIRVAAQIAAIVDSTGISDTVAAYTYPKCSKYGFSPTGGTSTTGATSGTPASVGGKLDWVASTGAMPANAVIGGQESGRTFAVCRGSHQGGTHPGKVVAGKCNIGWGGKEIELTRFDVLTNAGATLAWVAGPAVPSNAVIGGQESGRTLAVCRSSHQGGVHPGKVVAGKCNIGWGGKEVTAAAFEVLTQK